MARHRNASSAVTFLVLLTAASSLVRPAAPESFDPSGYLDGPRMDTPPGHLVPRDGERGYGDRQSMPGGKGGEEEEEELFKDVDPKKLAAVLLEALNRSRGGSGRGEEEEERGWAGVGKQEAYREVSAVSREDRDRDGRQELELLLAGKEREREEEEEEERRRAQEEEERMTEKVTSHTTSQVVQVAPAEQPAGTRGEGANGQGASPQRGAASADQGGNEPQGEEPEEEEEEEQLNPEELKSLETMMKEFPRLNTATKREGHSEANQRESRGYSSFNEVIPAGKGGDLAMTKNKLKWQEETQKALHFPVFRGGNFMDDFRDGNGIGEASRAPPPAEQDEPEGDDEPEEDEEEEEHLSPEEEEARAKAEQEEMRRQAAEAQRAKLEEEKLADIASDMLLHYMVKQGGGGRRYSSSPSNAAEDKRSDEEQQQATGEDDIDPQTIDKLIEISSKLHLPADDVVDIISDVEKKKKKDAQPEAVSRWRGPQTPLPAPLSSPANQNDLPVPALSSPTVNLLKSWFQEKAPAKSDDPWNKPIKTPTAGQDLWAKPQKPLSVQTDPWPKSPGSLWTSYPPYPYTYPSYYRRRPYSYYPVYFSPPPRPQPRFYFPKPPLAAGHFFGSPADASYAFPPKRRYQSWVQPRLRKPPPGLQRKPFYAAYALPPYPRTFRPLPIPKPWSPPPQMPKYPSQHRPAYHAASRDSNYYAAEGQADPGGRGDLEKYIQQILMKRPQRLD